MNLIDQPSTQVLFRRSGGSRTAQIGLLGILVSFGVVGFAGLATSDIPPWLTFSSFAVATFCLVGFVRFRQMAYLINSGAITERSGFRLTESPPIHWADVVAISWQRPALPRWPKGCIIWATTGGHESGLNLRAIGLVMAPWTRELRDQLIDVHGSLGAIYVDHSLLTKDDSDALLDVLRSRGFAPLPVKDEPIVGLVSLPHDAG